MIGEPAHQTNRDDSTVVIGEAKRGQLGKERIQRHMLLIDSCRQPAWLRVIFQQH